MADGYFPTLISKDADDNALDNPIYTQLTDGTGALHKAVDDAAGGTDSGIATLVVRDDTLSTLTPADGDYTTLRVNSEGALWIAGNITASPESVEVDDTPFTTGTDSVSVVGGIVTTDEVDAGDLGAFAMTTRRQMRTVIEDAAGDALDVNADGSLNVTVIGGGETPSTDEFHDYDTSAAVAGGATDNHDYTVGNTTGLLKSCTFAASGALKAEIQAGPLASLATVAVGFIPKQGGSEQYTFDPPVEATGTSPTFRVIRTNRENQAQDVYSSLHGRDQ